MIKEWVLFFVLQLLKIALLTKNTINTMTISILKHSSPEFQFSVSGSGFSVFFPDPGKYNSLYRDPVSLYWDPGQHS